MSSHQAIDSQCQRPERDLGVPHFDVVCVRCGGALRSGRLRCAACSRETTDSDSDNSTAAKRRGANQFSIESLLLVTTFVASCLGLSAAFPPVGIVVSMLALAALLRTLIAGRQQLRAGSPFGVPEKLETFFTSALMVYFAVGFGFLIVLSFCAVAWLAHSLLVASSRAQRQSNSSLSSSRALPTGRAF